MLSYSVGSNRLPATRPADAGCQKRNDLPARELNPAFGSAGKWIDRFGPAFCICYFFWLATVGLKAFFTHDDALNLVHLHGYFHVSIFEILQQALTVVSADYRPVGGLFYRLMYAVFGFDPFPFRAAAFALMGANLALTYNLVRTLSGSREAALTAAFLLGYNASFVELYHSTGTIYDILCFGFFVGAFQIYINSRSIGENFTIKRIFCIVVLYCCALGSKEMAVTFPIVLILYELFYHSHQFRIRNVLASLFKPHLLAVAGLAMLTAAYAAAKTASAAFSTNSLYSPDFSFGVFAAALHHYLPRWLHLTLDETGALVLVGAAAAVALLASRQGTHVRRLLCHRNLVAGCFYSTPGRLRFLPSRVGLRAVSGLRRRPRSRKTVRDADRNIFSRTEAPQKPHGFAGCSLLGSRHGVDADASGWIERNPRILLL